MGGLPDIGLAQHLAVHLDNAGVKVDVHGLALHGDDPLDDGLAILKLRLGRDDHVPLLVTAAEVAVYHQKQIPVLKGIPHGPSGDAHHPGGKGEQQHRRQHGAHQGLGPFIERPARLRGFCFFRHSNPSVGHEQVSIFISIAKKSRDHKGYFARSLPRLGGRVLAAVRQNAQSGASPSVIPANAGMAAPHLIPPRSSSNDRPCPETPDARLGPPGPCKRARTGPAPPGP